MGPTTIYFLGPRFSSPGRQPDAKIVWALANIVMPADVSLHSLIGGLLYYCKFRLDLSKRFRPLTDLLENPSLFEFTLDMERLVRVFSKNLVTPPVFHFPARGAAMDWFLPSQLHSDACHDGFGATLEQQQ